MGRERRACLGPVAPGTDRGLSLSLRQGWGVSPTGGMDALLGRETLAGLAANDNAGSGPGASGNTADATTPTVNGMMYADFFDFT